MAGRLVLIGGTTASGKSALALAVAERTGGIVVNADSVQLHRDLPILTARPDSADLARAEHRLYGILDAHEAGSVAGWLARIEPILAECTAEGRTAIVTGGTGLYFKALLEGLPAMPDIPAAIRTGLRAERAPTPSLHARLEALDPAMAARLRPSDRQRILRALEVVLATRRSLLAWQQDPPHCIALPAERAGIALLPPRELLLRRIEARLDAMLARGLLAELAAFLDRLGSGPSPLLKADGVAEFAAHLAGRCDLSAARAATVVKIRRYAKRQRTFFRHQLADHMPVLECVGEAVDPIVIERLAALDGGCVDSRATAD